MSIELGLNKIIQDLDEKNYNFIKTGNRATYLVMQNLIT